MPRIAYEDWTPHGASLDLVEKADSICAEYARQGYDLTLRQLYYQFVARGFIPNTQQSYKRLGDIVNKARMAGLLDWDYIVDRTRNLRSLSHWGDPASIINSAAHSYHRDLWETQPTRVEVWVEKEALAGVVQRAAAALDCAWFSCRGYVSQSEMWNAAQRLDRYAAGGQDIVILHLGDHDPSGIDMTRDITDRLDTFRDWDTRITVHRVALNMDQVEEYNPPPNPAKLTDSRAMGYVNHYGRSSWELDALDPATLEALITEHIEANMDRALYEAEKAQQEQERGLLLLTSDAWDDIVSFLDTEEE